MIDGERSALEALRFDWAQAPEDVWQPSPFHVDGLHDEVMQRVGGGIADARDSRGASPIGVAIQGQRGAGKTHMLGLVRERVQAEGGYFFLVGLLDGGAFWQSVALAMVEGLQRETAGQQLQLTTLLRRLCRRAGTLRGVQSAVLGEADLTRRDLASFTAALRRLDRQVGLECQDTARALVLLHSTRYQLQDIGYHYLQSMVEAEPGDRSAWGLHRAARAPQLVVRDISRLLALTGPSVIAVDQIDALIAQFSKLPAAPATEGPEGALLEQVAGGLMSLREDTRRTLTVVACLPESWILIKEQAVNTVADRFREALQLHRIPDAGIGEAIVARRFAARFAQTGFTPPYPTWPVARTAFADAVEFTPRGLLQRIDAHLQGCLRRGEVSELTELVTPPEPATPATPVAPLRGDLAALDARFDELRNSAEVAAALDPGQEDTVMPRLLQAALTAWITERDDPARRFAQDPPPGRRPALHARLRRILDERTEDELHWAFRAIGSGNARAVQARIRNAATMAGLRADNPQRRVFLVRSAPWPGGAVTGEVVAAFAKAGGVTLPVTEADLRTCAALHQLLAEPDANLPAWLVSRQWASNTALLRSALGEAIGAGEPAGPTTGPAEPTTTAPELSATTATERATAGTERSRPLPAGGELPAGVPSITLGVAVDSGQPVRVSLESLRKHTAIFAGSGSGKTVLIRRLLEECARHGVSAIVLDPNNDLARLGDPWPQPPTGWGPGDAAAAEDYLAHTDVVVWTPRREAGRPLSFQPLPDFRAVRDDPDELASAIDAALAALVPRAKVDGRTSKAAQGQAVLREALRHFAYQGGGHLKSFVSLLAHLPEGVSALDRGGQLAAELAQTLTAAMVIDPLFGGDGSPADPGVLLRPPAGKRARLSVISMIGLNSDEQRQSFVNQLQMALFAWLRKHPATDRPLGGLFVMDEAQTLAPATATTACTQSTLALVSQARKYGLGLVFATQAPKGLHNQIPGNAATQLFGFLNSPVQIEAAREMARAKGSTVLDISRLGTGEFYAAGTGLAFQKLRTPLCLSYHPSSPLTTEEVIARARAG
jgi:hypothetical protein